MAMTYLFLSVLLTTGYMGDDPYNSQIVGSLLHENKHVLQRTIDEMVGWMKGPGRLFPLGWYHYYLHYYVRSLIVYKSMTVTIVLADTALLAILARRLTRSTPVGILAGLMVPAFFQFRGPVDPFMGFGFLLPLLTFYVFSAAYCFQRYLDHGSRAFFWISLILHLIALLTYEVSYFTFALMLLLAYPDEGGAWKAWRAARAHVLLAAAVILASILLKTRLNPYFQHGYPGAELHTNPAKTLHAFLIQAYAAFPLSFHLKAKSAITAWVSWKDKAALALFFLCNSYLLTRVRKGTRFGALVALGLILWTGPSALIAVSGHQDEIIGNGYGHGYLPVYLGYFGLGAASLGAFLFLYERVESRRARIALNLAYSFALTMFGMVNLGGNRAVAQSTHAFHLYPRQVLEHALDHGLLDGVPEGSHLLRLGRFPHDLHWYFSSRTGKLFQAMDPTEHFKKSKLSASAATKANVYLVAYTFDPERGETGAAYLAPLDEAVLDAASGEPVALKIRKLRVIEYPTGATRELAFGDGGVDFLPALLSPASLPPRAADFHPLQIRNQR